jgi:HD-GYP domain-containing protein (c-di-GMP phosphodiesterase class II)
MTQIRMDILSQVISRALDILENELAGASENHSMRVAVLCSAMGRRLGLGQEALSALATCALFHDNALSEYMLSERTGAAQKANLRLHCQYGQRNVAWLPFKSDIDGFILYHHERADGKGPFGKKEGEYPLEAELIMIADMADVSNHLQRLSPQKLSELRQRLESAAGRAFTRRAAAAMLEVLDEKMLESLSDEHIYSTIREALPVWAVDTQAPAVSGIAAMLAHVIDYKSIYTRKHTMQIANRAWIMGKHYNYRPEEQAQLYLAAALHDIGKLAIPADILEKPGKLDDEEFAVIKQHVFFTHEWLQGVPGLEDVCRWASSHHEKLDGSGYPFGKKAEELDFNSRLLACIDIYQAVNETRPYHPARTHAQTMAIIYELAGRGLIDRDIAKDLDAAMAEYDDRNEPEPGQPEIQTG